MKQIAVALFAVASTFGVGSAMAQQQEHPVRATIPFNFTVGDKVLPTGTYTVLQINDDVIEIRNADGSVAVLSSADLTDDQYGYPHLSNSILVFDRDGDRYFLREVAGGPGAVNDNLPLSRAERKAHHQENIAFNRSQISIPASEGN